MGKMTEVPLAISSSSGRSKKSNASELINLYINLEDAGSKTKALLVSSAGAEVISVFNYYILGLYRFKGVVYVVTKDKLYSITKNSEGGFDKTVIGSIGMVGKVSFADNGIEMVFVGGGGYSYNPDTDTLKDMSTEAGWYPSNTVAYMDGYFIFSRTGTGQFFISDLFATTINPIDWATGEAAPDDTVAVAVLNRQLWIIGEKSTEVWYDSGDVNFPFTRIAGAVNDIGAMNYETVSKALNDVFFVGDDLRIYQTKGYQLEPISTQSIEYQLKNCDVTTLYGFTFHERGRWFYAITINDNKTLVYDLGTGLWHTRESDDVGRWKMDGVFSYYDDGINYGYAKNNLYVISEDIHTEDGMNVKREIISLPLSNDVNRIRIHELELDMEVGMITPAEITLQLSSDGGKTWGNKMFASTGAAGQGLARVKWNRLGQHRNVVAKIVAHADTPIKILSLSMRAD